MMEEAALRKRIADLQERNETLEASLRAANDEISRLRAGADAAARHLDASEDAAAWVSSQLQLHDREQASQRLLLTICELLQVPEPANIVPALSSVVRAVRKLPQMDSFIGEVAAIVLETRRTNNKNPIYNLTRRVRKQQFFFFEPDGPPAAGNFPPMMPDIIPSTTGRDSLE